jgi:cell division septation protein DedD
MAEGKPAVPAVPRASPGSTGDYTIQVSAFRSLEQASELKGRLSKKGYGAYVQSVELNDKGTWHRVRIGNYQNREGAERIASDLRTREHLPAVVTRR